MAAYIIAIRYNQIGKKKNQNFFEHWAHLLPENARTGTNKNWNPTEKRVAHIFHAGNNRNPPVTLAYPFISLWMRLTSGQKWYMYQLCNHPSTRACDFQLRLPEGSSFLIHIKVSVANFTPDLEHPEHSFLRSCSYRDRLQIQGCLKSS